ncbi:MAG: hypothetical protein ABSF80_01465 [Chitinispirillaceae bacterium]
MILFPSKKMETAIAGDTLSGSHKVIFLALFSLMYFPSVVVSIIQPKLVVQNKSEYPALQLVNALVFLGLTAFTVSRCQKINATIDGKNIIERYLLLSIPVAFKTTVVALAGLCAAGSALYFAGRQCECRLLEIQIAFLIDVFLLGLFFYGSFIRSFKRLNKINKKRINNSGEYLS